MNDTISQFQSFIKEAYEDAAAFSRVGQDDNGYDATSLAWEAEAIASAMEANDGEQLQSLFDNSNLDGPFNSPMEWLNVAKERLNGIS